MIQTPDRRSRILGCLLGGALGDAVGAPAKFMKIEEIRHRFGESGITGVEKAYGGGGTITEATQMTLFTAEGVILSKVRSEYSQEKGVTPAVYHAYLRWLSTQEVQLQGRLIEIHGTCFIVDGILTGYQELYSRRAPENTSLTALRSGKMGTLQEPLNESKRCGGILRAAPIGLAFSQPEVAFQKGCESAAITHGHPSGYLAAGFFSSLISVILAGDTLVEAMNKTRLLLKTHENSDECVRTVETAVELSQQKGFGPEEIETLGGGWVAEEALAIGLCCALSAGEDFEKGVLLSVNHSGDSNATGSITGSILGALYGKEIIPYSWLSSLELKEVIEEIATDLADQFTGPDTR